MCGPKGYGFSAVLVIDRVSILANFMAILDINGVWFLHFSLDMGMFLREVTFSSLSKRKSTKGLQNCVYGLVGTKELIITQL